MRHLALLAGLVGSLQLVHGAASSRTAQSIAYSTVLTRSEDLKPEYDYIVVGGGTAGLTVADRLTESGKYSVLVIELGHFQNSSSVTTVAFGYLGLIDPSLSYNFPSVPQTNLNGRTVGVIAGMMLGGSSGVNGMQVHRGQREDYDRWGSYFGKKSEWSWDGLLPYFKKAWHFHPPNRDLAKQFDIKYDESYWGKTSNVHASFPTDTYPFLKTEMAAFGEIPGVEYPPDSGAGLPGAFWYPASADPGPMLRSFSRPGHWDGISQQRQNYHTVVDSRVLKILFKGQTATGVLYASANATTQDGAKSVSARKEVIVAAGTIHTPQILQASGIGPKKVLQGAKLEVVVDLPGVGSNFQDHAFEVGAYFNVSNFPFHPDVTDLENNATFRAEADAEFAANRTGFLTIASGNCASFLPLSVITPNFDSIAARYEAQDPAVYLPADADKTLVAGYAAQKAALAKAMRSRGSAFYNHFLRGTFLEGAIVNLHTLSRGTIHINASDPFFSQPLVDYRALSNPADLDVLVEFTRFTRRYWLETSLKKLQPVETVPGAQLTTYDEIASDVRARMIPSVFHPIGTAAMMPRNLGGVVDEKLLVYGVKRLSVVDASVFPDLPGAYTQQTVYAVAEKAADLIKARA